MAEPKLLDQYRDRIRVKHYSLRTEDSYLHWIRRFIFFHGKKHPRDMGGPQVAHRVYAGINKTAHSFLTSIRLPKASDSSASQPSVRSA